MQLIRKLNIVGLLNTILRLLRAVSCYKKPFLSNLVCSGHRTKYWKFNNDEDSCGLKRFQASRSENNLFYL
jgi:hypothetical protein